MVAGVGRAVRDSGIPRAELFITTKLWIQNPGEAIARAAFVRSLERLGLDHIFDYALSDDEMGRIATLDTGASVFFDHRDPAVVSWLNSRRDT
ncbi:MAG: hypothetical protein PV358_08060 [Acidimicrobiales bacterium]|nr:hypothetical protein [Acidimicrobiales bacterium]